LALTMTIVAHHYSARQIAEALRLGRKSGSGYSACCPAHEDRTPSLSLRDAGDGRVLVHCHSGCPQEAVIAALRDLGLWPEQERRWLPEAEYRQQARKRREAEAFEQALQPSYRAFLRELEARRDDLIFWLRWRADADAELELEILDGRIDCVRRAIGEEVEPDAAALTIAIVDLIIMEAA
jgi:CHC2 zinc finger